MFKGGPWAGQARKGTAPRAGGAGVRPVRRTPDGASNREIRQWRRHRRTGTGEVPLLVSLGSSIVGGPPFRDPWAAQLPCNAELPFPAKRGCAAGGQRARGSQSGRTPPVWLTVRVPAGEYRGEVALLAGDTRVAVPVELRVDPFTLPDERDLLVTHRFNTGRIARARDVSPD